jgi:hypothetical protein
MTNTTEGPRSKFKIFLSLLGLLISTLYLLNFSLGIFEIIPDYIPFVGNLDEAFFSGIFLGCLRYLGLDLIPFKRKPKPILK